MRLPRNLHDNTSGDTTMTAVCENHSQVSDHHLQQEIAAMSCHDYPLT